MLCIVVVIVIVVVVIVVVAVIFVVVVVVVVAVAKLRQYTEEKQSASHPSCVLRNVRLFVRQWLYLMGSPINQPCLGRSGISGS